MGNLFTIQHTRMGPFIMEYSIKGAGEAEAVVVVRVRRVVVVPVGRGTVRRIVVPTTTTFHPV